MGSRPIRGVRFLVLVIYAESNSVNSSTPHASFCLKKQTYFSFVCKKPSAFLFLYPYWIDNVRQP